MTRKHFTWGGLLKGLAVAAAAGLLATACATAATSGSGSHQAAVASSAQGHSTAAQPQTGSSVPSEMPRTNPPSATGNASCRAVSLADMAKVLGVAAADVRWEPQPNGNCEFFATPAGGKMMTDVELTSVTDGQGQWSFANSQRHQVVSSAPEVLRVGGVFYVRRSDGRTLSISRPLSFAKQDVVTGSDGAIVTALQHAAG